MHFGSLGEMATFGTYNDQGLVAMFLQNPIEERRFHLRRMLGRTAFLVTSVERLEEEATVPTSY